MSTSETPTSDTTFPFDGAKFTDVIRIVEFCLACISFTFLFLPSFLQFWTDRIYRERKGLRALQRVFHPLLLVGSIALTTGSILMFWSITDWQPAISISCNELLGWLFTVGLSMMVEIQTEAHWQIWRQRQEDNHQPVPKRRPRWPRFVLIILNSSIVLVYVAMVCVMVFIDNNTRYKAPVFLLNALTLYTLALILLIESRGLIRLLKPSSGMQPELRQHQMQEHHKFRNFVYASVAISFLVGCWVIMVSSRSLANFAGEGYENQSRYVRAEPRKKSSLLNAVITRVLGMLVVALFVKIMWVSDLLPCGIGNCCSKSEDKQERDKKGKEPGNGDAPTQSAPHRDSTTERENSEEREELEELVEDPGKGDWPISTFGNGQSFRKKEQNVLAEEEYDPDTADTRGRGRSEASHVHREDHHDTDQHNDDSGGLPGQAEEAEPGDDIELASSHAAARDQAKLASQEPKEMHEEPQRLEQKTKPSAKPLATEEDEEENPLEGYERRSNHDVYVPMTKSDQGERFQCMRQCNTDNGCILM